MNGTPARLTAGTLITPILCSAICALLVACAVMYGRSATIRGVREIDSLMLGHLARLAAQSCDSPAADHLLQGALESLRPSPSRDAYLGFAMWRGDTQVAANHSRLRAHSPDVVRMRSVSDARYRVVDLGADPAGLPVTLASFRPERSYTASPWLFFVTPIQQWLDPDVGEMNTSAVVRRALFPSLLAAAIVLAVMLLDAVRLHRATDRAQARLREVDQERCQLEESIANQSEIVERQVQELAALREEQKAYPALVDQLSEREIQVEAVRAHLAKLTANVSKRTAELDRAAAQQERILRRSGRNVVLFDVLQFLGWDLDCDKAAKREIAALAPLLLKSARRKLWLHLVALAECKSSTELANRHCRAEALSRGDLQDVYHWPGPTAFKVYWRWEEERACVYAVLRTDDKHTRNTFFDQLAERVRSKER
ncbi:MAG: hypothetical protein KA745_05440 [Gemmatimonadales bacterium]|nr:hypothetical protein [Gemmatimonadales bacterium]